MKMKVPISVIYFFIPMNKAIIATHCENISTVLLPERMCPIETPVPQVHHDRGFMGEEVAPG
jgi:hypothetical protein